MIAPSLPFPAVGVVKNGRDVMRLSEALRVEAAAELAEVFDGTTGKRVRAAAVPGASVTFLSRATNGDACNPLYRLASLVLLMRRLGVDRARAQRLVDWLQEIVDSVYGPATEEAQDINNVLDKDKELDALDEVPQQRAVRGCVDSTRQLIEIKRAQRAHARTVVMALRHRLLTMVGQ